MTFKRRAHVVKTWPAGFQAQLDGIMTFNIRYNMDRGFQRGDIFVQREFVPNPLPLREHETRGHFTGREMVSEITFVSSEFGVHTGYVALQLMPYTGSNEDLQNLLAVATP